MRLLRLLPIVIAAVVTPGALRAQDYDAASLAGLPGVFVSVHASGRDLPDGLSDELLVSGIERDLRQAGVPVLTEDELRQAPGAPVLQVSVVTVLASNASGAPLGFGYAIQVEVVQNVVLERETRVRHDCRYDVAAAADRGSGFSGRGRAGRGSRCEGGSRAVCRSLSRGQFAEVRNDGPSP